MQLLVGQQLLAHRFGERTKSLCKFSPLAGQSLVSFDDKLFEPSRLRSIKIIGQLLPGDLAVGGGSVLNQVKQPFGADLVEYLPNRSGWTDDAKRSRAMALEAVPEPQQSSQKGTVAMGAIAKIDLNCGRSGV